MLKLIKSELEDSTHFYMDKRLIWLVCSLNFYSCFGVHETFARSENSLDPAFTLIATDLELNTEDKPDKSFGPSTWGIVLWGLYDMVNLTLFLSLTSSGTCWRHNGYHPKLLSHWLGK